MTATDFINIMSSVWIIMERIFYSIWDWYSSNIFLQAILVLCIFGWAVNYLKRVKGDTSSENINLQ